MNEVDIIDHLEEVNSVASEYLKGKTEAEIARDLGLPRTRVVAHVQEWKSQAANSDAVRSRAREALSGADQHYTRLIKQAYEIAEDAVAQNEDGELSANQSLDHRGRALKMVADLEAKRIDMLQKAGLLENQELAEQLIEQEQKQEAIMSIIKDVVSQCSHCKPKVLQRMAGMGNQPVVIVEGQVD